MLYSSTEVTELVCTRISHDLIGNIGAMSNGLEILGGEGEVIDDETKNILQTAVDILKYRQKFSGWLLVFLHTKQRPRRFYRYAMIMFPPSGANLIP